jgi:hypothetical protein
MARLARREVVDPAKQQVLHCTQRCVRRAHLCEEDPVTGISFEHRRGWIRAAMAETLETSQYAGAKDRIDDLNARTGQDQGSEHDWERARRGLT